MSDFIVKETPGKGKGLFATKHYEKGQVIFKFEGIKLDRETSLFHPETEKLLQIGLDSYLDVSEHYSLFINHSCKPNCFIKISVGHVFSVAYLPIKPGDELTFDYSTTSTDFPEDWNMPCKCSVFGCRKNISGFVTLPYELQQSYIDQGVIPNYLK